MEQETAVVETKRTQIRIEPNPNASASAGNGAAQQGDKTAGETTPRRPAPRKIYNKEEQPTRGE
jgi:hypothetical protein